MKHTKTFSQFIDEKKDEKYIAHVNDGREPGGSDKDIKKDYNLDVENRDNDGFDIVGSKEDVQAFIDDYGIILDDEIELYESAEVINEAVTKYYTVEWNRNDAKEIFDYKNKIMDLAEKGMKALPAILEETNPGLFDVDNIGFAFKGNAAFVFANTKDGSYKGRMNIDYDKIEDNKEFKNYFDMASMNLDSGSQREFSSYFRLDDRKR